MGTNIRYIIPNNKINHYGNRVRVKLAYYVSSWSFSKVYIGHKAGSGDVYDFDGNQKVVTFNNGSLSGTVGVGGLWSDWIWFDLIKGQDLICSIFLSSSQNLPRKNAADTYDCYYKTGDDESALSDVTGYSEMSNKTHKRLVDSLDAQAGEHEIGAATWGHVTGADGVARTFTQDWTGTGEISGSGDAEKLTFYPTHYKESPAWELGAGLTKIQLNKHQAGSGITAMKYKTGYSQAGCDADTWHEYDVGGFTSLGFVKIRLEY